MNAYMLAQIRLRYGPNTLTRYDGVMVAVRRFFEDGGVMLLHGMITRVGPLYEAWNLWKIDDQAHIARVFKAMHDGEPLPWHVHMMQTLEDIVVEENVRFLEDLPFVATQTASPVAV